nr:DUF1294 domain-containing protein [uncultured Ruminococcus sp.]
MLYFLIIYLVVVNIIAIALTIYDKRASVLGLWRVRESTLMLFSFLGGSVLMYLTMRIIHHKTRHPLFMVGIPIIFVLQIIFTLVVLYAVGYIG